MTEEQVAQLIKDNAGLRAEIKQLKAIISELLKRLYGSKSEQMDANQLMLLLSEDGAKKPEAAEPGGQEPEVANCEGGRDDDGRCAATGTSPDSPNTSSFATESPQEAPWARRFIMPTTSGHNWRRVLSTAGSTSTTTA